MFSINTNYFWLHKLFIQLIVIKDLYVKYYFSFLNNGIFFFNLTMHLCNINQIETFASIKQLRMHYSVPKNILRVKFFSNFIVLNITYH